MMTLEELEANAQQALTAGKEVREAIGMVCYGLRLLRKHRRSSRPLTARRQVIDTFRVGLVMVELADMGMALRPVPDTETVE